MLPQAGMILAIVLSRSFDRQNLGGGAFTWSEGIGLVTYSCIISLCHVFDCSGVSPNESFFISTEDDHIIICVIISLCTKRLAVTI